MLKRLAGFVLAASFGLLLLAAPAAAQTKIARIRAPELEGGVGWLGVDQPLRLQDLRGKIVVLDFWTLC